MVGSPPPAAPDARTIQEAALRTPLEQDALVRQAIYQSFAARGKPPTRAAIALATALAPDEVASSYERLSMGRAIVLDAATGEVRMAMPFSAVATAFRVRPLGADAPGPLAWWANCAWDALGIAAATGRDVEIVTDCPDCHDRLTIRVEDGAPTASGGVVHFLVPAARWWEDIGFT